MTGHLSLKECGSPVPGHLGSADSQPGLGKAEIGIWRQRRLLQRAGGGTRCAGEFWAPSPPLSPRQIPHSSAASAHPFLEVLGQLAQIQAEMRIRAVPGLGQPS